MSFGVFIHRADSIYKDSPAERYHFPAQYLSRARATIGDWIVYYEPRKVVETRGYFAVAKVAEVVPDGEAEGMFYAVIAGGSYLDFPHPVAFAGGDGLVEQGLLNAAGNISGRAQAAVRPLSATDFRRIVDLGLADEGALLPRIDNLVAGDDRPIYGFAETQAPFDHGETRDRVDYLGSRIVRDRVFRRTVLRAYDERCAITGLKLINGGGRAEAEAAHIKPVEHSGPDSISNGIALSGTAHWMFDRGLIGLADDLRILVSRQVNNPDDVHALINRSGFARLPQRPTERPHPHFLQWHREHCFKH